MNYRIRFIGHEIIDIINIWLPSAHSFHIHLKLNFGSIQSNGIPTDSISIKIRIDAVQFSSPFYFFLFFFVIFSFQFMPERLPLRWFKESIFSDWQDQSRPFHLKIIKKYSRKSIWNFLLFFQQEFLTHRHYVPT